ncbi:MAG: ABC-2 family transporter protein [Anaerolineaceae bacterium]|nr:ABC-2 family transporter protein [Anaerolineaceae bacterium]
MKYLKLVSRFIKASLQEETAYAMNFWINIIQALINLGTGVLGIVVLFGQVESIKGWNLERTLVLLGVYLTVSALRALFFGPSLEALAGMDGEVWTGNLDFTLLKPVNFQFLASTRKWRPFALLDLTLALGVLVFGLIQLGPQLSFSQLALFTFMLTVGVVVLYSILLFFAALVFWSPGVLYTWVFDGFFQLARYPVSIYPGWLQMLLTWVVPVGVITTIPVDALMGTLSFGTLFASIGLAVVLFWTASWFLRFALRRYSSASS